MGSYSHVKSSAKACLIIVAIRAVVMAMMGWFMGICLTDLLPLETTSMGRLLSPIGLH